MMRMMGVRWRDHAIVLWFRINSNKSTNQQFGFDNPLILFGRNAKHSHHANAKTNAKYTTKETCVSKQWEGK